MSSQWRGPAGALVTESEGGFFEERVEAGLKGLKYGVEE